jgi:membrane-associated phospholipid phosphatase
MVMLCLRVMAIAQDGDSTRTPCKIIGDDALILVRGTAHVLSSPLRWDGRDWSRAGMVVAGTGGASLLDEKVYSLMHRNETRSNDHLANAAVVWGDGAVVVLATGAAYTAGLVFRQQWVRETSLLIGTSLVVSGTVSTITKVIAGRARPYMNLGNHRFKPLTFADDGYLSCPSGHSIVAFSLSTVLARRIHNPWATAVLYLLAGGTAVSRMYTQDHWLSDVVFGAATATCVSSSVVSWFEGSREEDSTLRIVPQGSGLACIWTF